jgi:hypothetical protein
MNKIKWQIGRLGRAWQDGEAIERHNLLPEPTKIEMHQGKLFWNDDERLLVAGMLLENLGVDKVLTILDPDMLLEALFIHEVGEEKLQEVIEVFDNFRKDDEN